MVHVVAGAMDGLMIAVAPTLGHVAVLRIHPTPPPPAP